MARKPRARYGTKDATGAIRAYRTKQEAVAMSTLPGRQLIRCEYTGPDLGWSEWVEAYA